jgi:hypothetical protein
MVLKILILAFALTGCSTFHLQEKVNVIEQNQKKLANGINAALQKVNTRLTLLENPKGPKFTPPPAPPALSPAKK